MQGIIRTVVYGVAEQVLLDLIFQNLLGETMNKRISKYLEAGKAAKMSSGQLLANQAFMTPIATFVQRKATKSVTNHYLAPTLEQALRMKHDKLEDVHTTTADLPKPVSSQFRTETGDERTSHKQGRHRKLSLQSATAVVMSSTRDRHHPWPSRMILVRMILTRT